MTPDTLSRKLQLKEGDCFKAIWVKCNRKHEEVVEVKAEEIQIVIDSDKRHFAAPLIDEKRKYRNRHVYEKRKIKMATSFTVYTPPMHLQLHETENGSMVIDVESGPLRPRFFPPMPLTKGIGYQETNAVEVLLGVDPSAANHWVSPVALRFVESVWESVSDAGGLFVADFDTSVGGWARFRTAYICPAPSETVYVQACKVRSASSNCCGRGKESALPLRFAGGRVYRAGFEPAQTELPDPVIFNDILELLQL